MSFQVPFFRCVIIIFYNISLSHSLALNYKLKQAIWRCRFEREFGLCTGPICLGMLRRLRLNI
jgi:hypothetical protein